MKFSYVIIAAAFIAGCDSKPGKSKNDDGAEEKKEKVTDGVIKSHFKSGKLRAEIPMKAGKKEGLAVEYYENGNKFQEIEYKGGIKEGLAKKYYESGQLAQETNYHEGKYHGVQKKYRANGKLTTEASYSNDEPCKGLKEYLIDGAPKKKYPDIVLKTEDHIMQEGIYLLKISLSEKVKEVEYYTGQLTDGACLGEKAVKIWNTDRYGFADIKFQVLPGQFIMQKVNVIAKVKTTLGNYYVMEKAINIAAENR
jgi:hypothetical protein